MGDVSKKKRDQMQNNEDIMGKNEKDDDEQSYMVPLKKLFKHKIMKQYRIDTQKKNRRDMTQSLYRNSYEEMKHQKIFQEFYMQKEYKLKEQVKRQIGHLLDSSAEINHFHSTHEKRHQHNHEMCSIGSISSADERDMELLFSGEHTYYFQSLELIKQFTASNRQIEFKKRELKDTFGQKFIKMVQDLKLRCNRRLKKPGSNGWQDKVKEISGKQFNKEEFKNAIDQLKSTIEIKKPARSGKELWKIAKKLIKKSGKNNVAQNVLKLNREMKALKQAQEQENRIQEFRDTKKKVKDQSSSIFDDDDDNFETAGLFLNLIKKIKMYYKKYLILPNNRKLQFFHLLVAVVLFYDFFLTGLIMGNYRFLKGQDQNFMNHEVHYRFICTIQITDILLNFLKIESGQRRKSINPYKIFIQYVKGNLVPDVVAVIPYAAIYPPFIFLRYLKLLKFNTYLLYFEEFIVEIFNHCMNSEQIKILISIFRLLVQVLLVSYFFACLWILMGMWHLVEYEEGWIHDTIEGGTQEEDFISFLITAVYWVITTFTSVGYGDILGSTPSEYIFVMLVEMVGICFFGYMIGTFQQLILGLGNIDHFTVQQESLDLWLMKLDKATMERDLISSVYKCVTDNYTFKFKNNAMIIQHTEFFQQLKPRLQRECLDRIFKNFYIKLKHPFENCDDGFKREVIASCEFRYYQSENVTLEARDKMYEEWPMKTQLPVFINAGQMTSVVYFILSGQIHIMDKRGLFDYGVLEEGSYFGDISALLNEPNEYSYFRNQFCEKPLQLLSIQSKEFLNICNKYKYSMNSMKQKARKRKIMFNNFKNVTLLSYMKSIKDHPKIITKKLTYNQTIIQRIQMMKQFDVKCDLFSTFIDLHNLKRMLTKFADQEVQQEKAPLARDTITLTERQQLKKDVKQVVDTKVKSKEQPSPSQEGLPVDFLESLKELRNQAGETSKLNVQNQLKEDKKTKMINKLKNMVGANNEGHFSDTSSIKSSFKSYQLKKIKSNEKTEVPVQNLQPKSDQKFSGFSGHQPRTKNETTSSVFAPNPNQAKKDLNMRQQFSFAPDLMNVKLKQETPLSPQIQKSHEISISNTNDHDKLLSKEPLKIQDKVQKVDSIQEKVKINFNPQLVQEDQSSSDEQIESFTPAKKPKATLEISKNIAQNFETLEVKPTDQVFAETSVKENTKNTPQFQNSLDLSAQSNQLSKKVSQNLPMDNSNQNQRSRSTIRGANSNRNSDLRRATDPRALPVVRRQAYVQNVDDGTTERSNTFQSPQTERTFVIMTKAQMKQRGLNKQKKGQPNQQRGKIRSTTQTQRNSARGNGNMYEGGDSSSISDSSLSSRRGKSMPIQVGNFQSQKTIREKFTSTIDNVKLGTGSTMNLFKQLLKDNVLENVKKTAPKDNSNSLLRTKTHLGKPKTRPNESKQMNRLRSNSLMPHMTYKYQKKNTIQNKDRKTPDDQQDSQRSINFDSFETKEEVENNINKLKIRLKKQLQLYFTAKQMADKKYRAEVQRQMTKAQNLIQENNYSNSDLDNEQRHPDGKEIERVPEQSEIENKVLKKQFNQSHYMDHMIEEYINIDHINLLSQKKDKSEPKIHLVKKPKAFLSVKEAREQIAGQIQKIRDDRADDMFDLQCKTQIDTFKKKYTGQDVIQTKINEKFTNAMHRQMLTNKLFRKIQKEMIDELDLEINMMSMSAQKQINDLEKKVLEKVKRDNNQDDGLRKNIQQQLKQSYDECSDQKKRVIKEETPQSSSRHQLSKFYHQKRDSSEYDISKSSIGSQSRK